MRNEIKEYYLWMVYRLGKYSLKLNGRISYPATYASVFLIVLSQKLNRPDFSPVQDREDREQRA